MNDAPDLAALLETALAAGTPGLARVALAQGAVFLDDRGAGDAAWLLLSGRARVFRVSAGGDMVVLAHRVAGELIGELALIDGGARSGSAVALTDLAAIRIAPACFAALMAQQPGFAHGVALQLTRRLRETSERTFAIAAAPIAARVAAELLRLAVPGPDGGAQVPDAPSITDLAVSIHATREHVSRLLGGWRRQGLIAGEGRTLLLPDPAALSDLLEF
jgi:CRP/FNR family transcriptional regulator, cyclic AMP receptor protein